MANQKISSGDILLYDNGGEKEFVSVIFKDETFWLTQSGIAELFGCTADNVSLHLKNIFAEEELLPATTTEKISVVRKEGSRDVRRVIDHYNLDAIIAVGYRVNSKKATRFRQWATKTLKEYITKGFVLIFLQPPAPFPTLHSIYLLDFLPLHFEHSTCKLDGTLFPPLAIGTIWSICSPTPSGIYLPQI